MKDSFYSTSELQAALAALAVLGRGNRVALAAVLGHDLPDRELAALADAAGVSEEDGEFTLDPDAASETLKAMERDNLPSYRQLHQRAIDYLTGWLRAGEGAVEPALLMVFERLANRLLTDDPEHLFSLVDGVKDLPLKTPIGRQRRSYFQGVALRKAGRFEEALEVFDVLLGEPGLDPQVHGRTLNSQAICNSIIGRPENARNGFRASLELWRQLGDRLNEGKALLNTGVIAYDLQDYDEAVACLSQAEAIFQDIGSAQWLAAAHNELGLIHRDQGHWSEALAHFEKFVAQRQAEGAQDYVGRGLNNIGEVLLLQGRLAEATAAFREALGKMTTRIYRVDAYLNLGLTFQATRDLAQAQAAFHAALDLALTIGRRDILPHVHYRLGDALRRRGDDAAALDQFRAGAEVIEATRAPLRDEELKISLLGRWQQVYEALVLHYLAQGRLAAAFEWAERARARAFADAMMKGHPALAPEKTEALSDTDQPLQSDVVRAAEVQAGLPTNAALFCYFTTGVVERDLPLLRAMLVDNPLREHLLTPAHTLLFVLTADRLKVHQCSIDPNAFATTSPRQADRNRFLAFSARRRLYDLLLKPAGDTLNAERLYVVPHGPLHNVPFGALINKGGQPLVDVGGPHLIYAPSATVLLRHSLAPSRQAGAVQPCLCVGFDGKTSEHALRHTEAEATFVAGLTKGVALVGRQTKKERLQALARDQRWLHFACHGRFNEQSPLESYLETGPGERLTAREVLQDWRLQADLVTLSACQTGVSRILRGDEPMGLVRAFLYAGARAVLASQWPVEDLPTLLLMQRFYRDLQRGNRAQPAEALLGAQVWLRDLTREEIWALRAHLSESSLQASTSDPLADLPPDARPFAHPRFWAAFFLVGA